VCSKGRSRKLCLRDMDRAAEIVDVFGNTPSAMGSDVRLPKERCLFSQSSKVSPACPCDKEERVDEDGCLI
jgi:hypothetical protein